MTNLLVLFRARMELCSDGCVASSASSGAALLEPLVPLLELFQNLRDEVAFLPLSRELGVPKQPQELYWVLNRDCVA